MDKFKFKTVSKRVDPIKLNKIIISDHTNSLSTTDVTVDSKITKIDEYYRDFQNGDFERSKVGSGLGRGKYDGNQIKSIYTLLYGEKPKITLKNDIIDEINKFFKEYKPSVDVDTGPIQYKYKKDESDSDDDFTDYIH